MKRFTFPILFVSLFCLSLVVVIVCMPQLAAWWLATFDGPRLEREFGFRAEFVNEPAFASNPTYMITELVADGQLARAGFKVGDVPVGYKHGFQSGFLGDLLWVERGEEAEIQVFSKIDYKRPGTSYRDWRTIKLCPGA